MVQSRRSAIRRCADPGLDQPPDWQHNVIARPAQGIVGPEKGPRQGHDLDVLEAWYEQGAEHVAHSIRPAFTHPECKSEDPSIVIALCRFGGIEKAHHDLLLQREERLISVNE